MSQIWHDPAPHAIKAGQSYERLLKRLRHGPQTRHLRLPIDVFQIIRHVLLYPLLRESPCLGRIIVGLPESIVGCQQFPNFLDRDVTEILEVKRFKRCSTSTESARFGCEW